MVCARVSKAGDGGPSSGMTEIERRAAAEGFLAMETADSRCQFPWAVRDERADGPEEERRRRQQRIADVAPDCLRTVSSLEQVGQRRGHGAVHRKKLREREGRSRAASAVGVA